MQKISIEARRQQTEFRETAFGTKVFPSLACAVIPQMGESCMIFQVALQEVMKVAETIGKSIAGKDISAIMEARRGTQRLFLIDVTRSKLLLQEIRRQNSAY